MNGALEGMDWTAYQRGPVAARSTYHDSSHHCVNFRTRLGVYSEQKVRRTARAALTDFYWSCRELAAATHLISAIYQRLFALPLLCPDKLSPPFISLSLFLFDSIVLSVICSLAHSLSFLTKEVALTADKAMTNIITLL